MTHHRFSLAEFNRWALMREDASSAPSSWRPQPRLRFRSRLSFVQNGAEIEVVLGNGGEGGDGEATVYFNLLTLAGPDTPLPSSLIERMYLERNFGGEALHDFLDMLNRPIWESALELERTGAHPHKCLSDSAARTRLDALAFALSGCASNSLDTAGRVAAQPETLYSLRYGVMAASGSGGARLLHELLHIEIGEEVRVIASGVFRASVLPQHRAVLGGLRLHARRGETRLGRSRLGNWAKVSGGLVLNAYITEAVLVSYFPDTCGGYFERIAETLRFARPLQPQMLSLKLHTLIEQNSLLGTNRSRLGWGAVLGGGRQTASVRISSNGVEQAMKSGRS